MNNLENTYKALIGLGDDCYGCGVCSAVCPTNVIGFRTGGDGFYRPFVEDGGKCTGCGLCSESCSALAGKSTEAMPVRKSFAAWTNDEAVRRKCSSGGIAYEIARQGVGSGTEACVVRYDPAGHRAEHYTACDASALESSVGSKYIQSYSKEGFREILRSSAGRKVVFGTPCQIASLRRYLDGRGGGGFLLVDFFCHGTPSMLLWRNYLKENGLLDTRGVFTFRDKTEGWGRSWAVNVAERGRNVYRSSFSGNGDMFFRLFLGNHVLNKPCYTCPFRMTRSAADIRVGDLWGRKYAGNDEGVSAVVAFTDAGLAALGDLKGVTLIEEPFDTVVGGQIRKDLAVPATREKLLAGLASGRPLRHLYRRHVLPYRIKRMPVKVFKYLFDR